MLRCSACLLVAWYTHNGSCGEALDAAPNKRPKFVVIACYFVGVSCWRTPPRFKTPILILPSLTIAQCRDSFSSEHDSETVHSMPPVIQDWWALVCLSAVTNLNVCVKCNWKIMMNIRGSRNNSEFSSSHFHTGRSSCSEFCRMWLICACAVLFCMITPTVLQLTPWKHRSCQKTIVLALHPEG